MNPLTLSLRRGEAAVELPAAWFLPFTDPAECLAELSRWPVQHERLRLFSVPRSIQDPSSVGVMVVVPTPLALERTRALPLKVLAGRLYLPLDAELFPPVTIEELTHLCLFPVMLFHPTTGLVGFDDNAAFGVADLLERPIALTESWNAAHPGASIHPPLTAIELELPQSFEELFGKSSQEIGVEPDAELPPAPDEPGAAGKIARGAGLLSSAMLAGAMKLFRSGGANKFLGQMQNWANSKVQKFSRDLENLRHKEIGRLLHMLDTDPESGLRHALPMNRFGGRGIASNPGARLFPHGLNFNLGALGGGAAVDPWVVTAEIQQRLSEKYRELANREMKLGRYRRAAYIFAELLGDLSSAAAALKQGKHYREAAVLYKDHLHSPVVAAECLAEGGLFTEAIAIFVERDMFVETASLYRKMGTEPEAANYFRKAVEQKLRNRNPLAAARLLENELGSPEEALAVLQNGWRDGQEATECLDAQFKLLNRLGFHDRALKTLEGLRLEEVPFTRTNAMLRVVVNAALEYPDREVRRFAGDLARVKAAPPLLQADAAEARELIHLLNKLVPEDRLFLRDGNRFITVKNEAQRARLRNQRVAPSGTPPVLLRSFDLPRYDWREFRVGGKHLFALGEQQQQTGSRLVLVRADWEGRTDGLSWDLPFRQVPPVLFAVQPERESWAIIHILYRESLPRQTLAATDVAENSTTCGTPGWLPGDTIGAASSSPWIWLSRNEREDLILERRHISGKLESNINLAPMANFRDADEEALSDAMDVPRPVQMATNGRAIAISHRASLLVRNSRGTTQMIQLPQLLRLLISHPPASKLCLGLVLKSQVLLYHEGTAEPTMVADDLNFPNAVFTGSGALVIASGSEGRIYQFIPNGVRRVSTFRWNASDIAALLPGPEPDQFATVSSRGTVRLFKLH